MANIIRWQPLRQMYNLRDEMDRLFEESFGLMRRTNGQTWGLALDVSENEGNYMVKAEVPGMEPEDLDISLTDNILTIRGETEAEKSEEGETYHMRERRFGRFSRSITLPHGIDADEVDADYDRGILTITVPKSDEVKPKRISVKSGSDGKKTIEGTTS